MRLLLSAAAALMILAGSQMPAQAGAANALAAKPAATSSEVQHVRAWRRGYRYYPRFYGYRPTYYGYYGYPGDYYASDWGYRSYGWGRPYLYGVPRFWGPRYYGPRFGFYHRRW